MKKSKLQVVDEMKITILCDDPYVYTSEDGLVRLSMDIENIMDREIEELKTQYGVTLRFRVETKSGDWSINDSSEKVDQ